MAGLSCRCPPRPFRLKQAPTLLCVHPADLAPPAQGRPHPTRGQRPSEEDPGNVLAGHQCAMTVRVV
jgi:hypothetical protein